MVSPQDHTLLSSSLHKVLNWVERASYRGYDPADGNASPLHKLTFGNLLLQRLLQQLVLRSPINIRPVLGIHPMDSSKARGYMVRGYIALGRIERTTRYLKSIHSCLDWLKRNSSPYYDNFCWGNEFNYATRGGRLPRYEPTIVWSSHIGHAFLDAFEETQERDYLQVAESVCDWIVDLPRETTRTGICLSYIALRQNSIHNSNLLGASLLSRTGALTSNNDYLSLARRAVEYSCTRQLETGAWLYGEERKYHWIDNFHTGYNLEALKCYIDSSGDLEFQPNLAKGYAYFKKSFFDPLGRPKYYNNRLYPIDIQSVAQSIDTFCCLRGIDPEAIDYALRTCRWAIANMQAPDGYFYYRRLRMLTVKVPMIHWGQATMFRALTSLLSV